MISCLEMTDNNIEATFAFQSIIDKFTPPPYLTRGHSMPSYEWDSFRHYQGQETKQIFIHSTRGTYDQGYSKFGFGSASW